MNLSDEPTTGSGGKPITEEHEIVLSELPPPPPPAPSPVQVAPELGYADQRRILAMSVTQWVSQGWRVEMQTDNQAVLVKGHRPNHLLHFFIGLFTLGLWWVFVWIPVAIFVREQRRTITVDPWGRVA